MRAMELTEYYDDMVWRSAFAYADCHVPTDEAVSFANWYESQHAGLPVADAFEEWQARCTGVQ